MVDYRHNKDCSHHGDNRSHPGRGRHHDHASDHVPRLGRGRHRDHDRATGQYPEGMFNFSVGVSRWSARVRGYTLLFVDEYPPFSLEAEPNLGMD